MSPDHCTCFLLQGNITRLLIQVDFGVNMEVMDSIREQVEGNSVILYMKGSPSQPQCGFSATAVQALIECGQRFAYVDVLSNPSIRANLPKYGDWPTFPQLWVAGELVGGSDIVAEMHRSGELKQLIDGAIEDTEVAKEDD